MRSGPDQHSGQRRRKRLRGEPKAARRFAKFARQYVSLRREHMRLDDRLFSMGGEATRALDTEATDENPESPSTQRLYERLIKSSTVLGEAASSRPHHFLDFRRRSMLPFREHPMTAMRRQARQRRVDALFGEISHDCEIFTIRHRSKPEYLRKAAQSFRHWSCRVVSQNSVTLILPDTHNHAKSHHSGRR